MTILSLADAQLSLSDVFGVPDLSRTRVRPLKHSFGKVLPGAWVIPIENHPGVDSFGDS